MSEEQDRRIKEIFKKAKQINRESKKSTIILSAAEEAALSVLAFYGRDPNAKRIDLKKESDNKLVARDIKRVLENILIAKRIIDS